jgi:hypothetical protein
VGIFAEEIVTTDTLGRRTGPRDNPSSSLQGLRVLGGTITPTLGCADCGGPAGEMTRQTVHTWIRGSGSFDGVATSTSPSAIP